MSEYKLSDRVRSGTDIMQRIVGGQRSALIELFDEVAALEAELDAVRRIMNQPWGDSHDRGHEEAFKRLAKIGNVLNTNSDPKTEDAPAAAQGDDGN